MEKVKLPKEDFEFLEEERKKDDLNWKQRVLRKILTHEEGCNTGFEDLLRALTVGYEVKEDPSKEKDKEFLKSAKFYFEQDMFLSNFLYQIMQLAKKTYGKGTE